MDKILIDYPVLRGHLTGNVACRQFIQKILLSSRQPALSVMTLYQLDCDEASRETIQAVIDLFQILPITADIAKTAHCITKGITTTPLSTEQTFTAATALTGGYTLVSLPEIVAAYSGNSLLADLFVFAVPGYE